MILLKEKNCRIADGADNWKDAVRLAVRPLEEDGTGIFLPRLFAQ